MEITLADARTLQIAFTYDAELVAAVKTIPGASWQKDAKVWHAPVLQLPAVEATFPQFSYSYDVWQAEAEAKRTSARQLYRLLRNSGATFSVANGRVHVEGECVSPLVQEVVAERSQWFAPLVNVASAKKEPAQREPVETTYNDELLAKSIEGALAAEERKQHYQRQRWQQPKQRSLFE